MNLYKLVNIVSIHRLQLALVMNCVPSVQWLVEHGADLNDEENPSFLLAVRYGNQEIIDYVVAQGG